MHSLVARRHPHDDPDGVAAGELEGAQLTVAEAVALALPERSARCDAVALALVSPALCARRRACAAIRLDARGGTACGCPGRACASRSSAASVATAMTG